MQKIAVTLKSAARRVIGPIARPIWRRVAPRLYRILGIRRELDKLSAAWHQHVPALVNAAASVSALAREQARMKREHEAASAQLRAEIEGLRAEIARLRGENPAEIAARTPAQ
jgi:cell division septum initiation protein DivIVA